MKPQIQNQKDESFRRQNNEFYQQILKSQTENLNQVQQQEEIYNDSGDIPAMLQAKRGQIPNKENEDDSNKQNNNGQTVALILASKGIIPPKQWNHDPEIQDDNCFTVEYYLEKHKLPIPNKWYRKIDESKQLNSPEIQQAIYNEEIDNTQCDPSQQNCDGWTVAMIQALNKKIPEERFKHDCNLKNRYGQTVEDLLKLNGLEVPEEWNCEIQKQKKDYNEPEVDEDGNTQAMKQALSGQKPNKKYLHKPGLKNKSGMTVAMILANKCIHPPKDWYHKSSIQNSEGNTVAMLLAKNGMIPQQHWKHQPDMKNKQNQTVALILSENGIDVPQEWVHQPDITDSNNNTVAMNLIIKGIIPDKQWLHSPEMQNKQGNTVAMLLVKKGILPKDEWLHDPQLKNEENHTVCYYLFNHGLQISKQWQDQQYQQPVRDIKERTAAMSKASNKQIPSPDDYHNPTFVDQNGRTVSMILAEKGIIPPKQWCHNPNIVNEQTNKNVAQYLQENQLPVPNEWYYYEMTKDHQRKPEFVQQAIYGQIPVKNEDIQVDYVTDFGWTISMLLAYNSIIPPKQWEHDRYLRNMRKDTVQKLLKDRQIEIPQQWKYISKLDDYYKEYGISYDIIITPEFKENKDQMTFAMYLAWKGIVPTKKWYHNKFMKDAWGNTRNIPVPQEWDCNLSAEPSQSQLTIFTKSDSAVKKIQQTLKQNGFQSFCSGKNVVIKNDTQNAYDFAKSIRLNGQNLNMKLE